MLYIIASLNHSTLTIHPEKHNALGGLLDGVVETPSQSRHRLSTKYLLQSVLLLSIFALLLNLGHSDLANALADLASPPHPPVLALFVAPSQNH